MKKTTLFLGLIILIITSCEKDDFCVKNPVTESLVIEFYDNNSKETLKNARLLSVWVEGKDTLSDYTSTTRNSITIPLNSLATETTYTFKKNEEDGAKADNQFTTFTITYTTEEEYVSRSCGYKIVFNEVTFSSEDNTWISSFTPISTLTTLENQEEAHVQIYH